MGYQQEDPVAFLESQGWPFKRQGQELVGDCPFCNKPGHLWMHQDTGVWKCHHCGESGNLYQLRKRLGLDAGTVQSLGQALKAKPQRIPLDRVEAMHKALLGDAEALEYATKTRGWSLEVLKRVKVGLRVDGRGKWITFPWWRRGECVGMKYRILPACQEAYPQRFDREPGCESVLFNTDALGAHDEILLASGESDALSLLTLGFANVVATTTGEGTLPASAVDPLSKKARVLIIYDNDTAGQKGAREAAKRIGFDRCLLVQLPEGVKDVNEFLLQGGTHETCAALLERATPFDIPSIYSLSQALDRLEEEKTIGAWDKIEEVTPWPSLNRRLGDWRGGNMIVLSGPQGTGKTTFALNVATHWAARGFPALVYCLEMNVDELVQHILCAVYEKPEEDVTANTIAQARKDLAEWPLYLGANPRATKRDEVVAILTQAVRRYGLKLIVFDNLHMLARSVEHRNEEIGTLTKAFKFLAMEMEIPLVLIAQPRKLQPGQVMTAWDLKDSVDIFSDADQIILLHRELVAASRDGEAVAAAVTEDADNLSPITLVRLAKARHKASRDAVLYFEGAEHRFRELQPGDVESGK
jgi:twinkle protein